MRLRDFIIDHWDGIERAPHDEARGERESIIRRACDDIRASLFGETPEVGAGEELFPKLDGSQESGASRSSGGVAPSEHWQFMSLLFAQSPSLPPLRVRGSQLSTAWQKVFDVDFLITVCDDLLAALAEAREALKAGLLAELATSGEVLESLHEGLTTMAKIETYVTRVSELRVAAIVRRRQLVDIGRSINANSSSRN